MTEPTVTPYPETPAAVAAAVLDQVEAHPEAFYMGAWVELGAGNYPALLASVAPACGTTLCAAGWAAHLTGWHIVVLPDDDPVEDIIVVEDDGTESVTRGSVFAEKDGERRLIGQVAANVLGLTRTQTFWYGDPETALSRLRQIAGRAKDEHEPDMDAGTGHGAYEYR
ncbi:hypothetical protein [Streptomyces sp. T028]|uniref:hypothetical protein n=1 Tax=Streptomyces sp. T028 TaxID=3394379 RepID=UPI003A8B9899